MDVVINDVINDNKFFKWLTLYRPISEFRIGGFSLRERLERIVGRDSLFLLVKNESQAKVLKRKLSINIQLIPDGEFIVINSGVIGSFESLKRLLSHIENLPVGKAVFRNDVFIAGKLNKDYLSPDMSIIGRLSHVDYPSMNLFYIRYPWDMFKIQETVIGDDALSDLIRNTYSILKPNRGKWPILVSKKDVYIEKYVYLETIKGPIIISDDSEIQAFSRISGPCVIREGVTILSARIRENVSIGPVSKIGGETESSIVDGYSNKAHESYLGHSYIGEWVNLGDFTVTSDLKNTYGPIRVTFEGEKFDTGEVKLGSFMGDFVKTSIGTLILAGKFIANFSHVMGIVYDNIPPFTFWNGYSKRLFDLDYESILRIQKRMYERRDIRQYPEEINYVKEIYESTSGERINAEKGVISLK